MFWLGLGVGLVVGGVLGVSAMVFCIAAKRGE